jgi:DNA-binding MarR family transcriptional regulator
MDTRTPPQTDVADDGYETGLTENDRLDLRVWLRLLTCSNLMERSIRQTMREQFDTTLPRFDILSQLDRAPDGLTMGELSRRLMVSNGNVTGLIARLVDEGLVLREPAPHDRRAQLVRLTKQGKKAFADMVPAHAALVKAHFAGVSRDQLAALHDLLGQLKNSVKQCNSGAQGA